MSMGRIIPVPAMVRACIGTFAIPLSRIPAALEIASPFPGPREGVFQIP